MKQTMIKAGASTENRLQTESQDDEIDLMELVRALWRGKWTILLATIVATSLGAYYVFGVAEPRYTSTVELTLETSSNQMANPESMMYGMYRDNTALNTELEIILSRRVLGSLVDELDLVNDPEFNPLPAPPSMLARAKGFVVSLIAPAEEEIAPAEEELEEQEEQEQEGLRSPRDRIVGMLKGSLSASIRPQTYVFTISATTGDPATSQRIANALADTYMNEQISVKFNATEKAVAWLSTRVIDLEEALREKAETLKTATAKTELISLEALEGLNIQAKDLRDRLQEMRSKAEQVKNNQSQMQSLLDRGDRLEAVELTQDATLQRLARSLQDGDTDTEQMFDQRLSAIVDRGQAERERMLGNITALSNSYQKLQARIDRQSEDLIHIQKMQRDVETTRTLYDTFLTRLKETSVQRGLQQADSRVLSDALSGAQVAPRAARVFALSMILGSVFGAGVVLISNFLHNVFRTVEDLEAATGIRVLGQIPKMPIKSRQKLIPYLQEKPTSAAAEAIRNLRTSILLSDIDTPPKMIMVTSSVPGEGKTTAAISLTKNLTGLGKKVLLIEGDIRRRTLSDYFEIQSVDGSAGGFIAAISGEKPLNEIVQYDERLEADVLMGEKTRINAADLFSSERFREFLERAREAYDFVIIDTPPVLVVSDARVIGQHVDAIIFTVAWNSTQRSQVNSALREFAAVNLRVSGLVLAQIDPKGMRRYGYGGKHGSYSAYGKGYYEAG